MIQRHITWFITALHPVSPPLTPYPPSLHPQRHTHIKLKDVRNMVFATLCFGFVTWINGGLSLTLQLHVQFTSAKCDTEKITAYRELLRYVVLYRVAFCPEEWFRCTAESVRGLQYRRHKTSILG